MCRIKCVAEILKPSGVETLSAVVKPDGNQGEQRQTLLDKLYRSAENADIVVKASQNFHVNIIQAQELSCETENGPDWFLIFSVLYEMRDNVFFSAAVKEIENKNRQDTASIIIHEKQISQQHAEDADRQTDQDGQPGFLFASGFFHEPQAA